MKEKIKKFIENNYPEVDFDGGVNSELNSVFTVLSGYADFIGASVNDILDAINEEGLFHDLEEELFRVYDFAKTYQYGKWWNEEEAKKQYKF